MRTLSLETTGQLHLLHRGELAAIQVYGEAMERFRDPRTAEVLCQLHADHRYWADELRDHVRQLGVALDQGSDSWEDGASAEVLRDIFDRTAAVEALKESEEQRIALAEKVLESGLPAECREAISNRYLPQMRYHVQNLGELLKS